ncbi:hypothetical protein Nepgr_003092 [Nepenthes gracilis]|uniref:Uncharacterized protein n=1 Tax=Nepenthes gracilis TaxID=150966 RepID=A0AAD3RYV8_NEPGR|nr:hypothetical protein Nepgr_003092 [Nepenthes gracilis]
MTISSSKLVVLTVLAFLLLEVSFMKFSTPTSNNYEKISKVSNGEANSRKIVRKGVECDNSVSNYKNLLPFMRRNLRSRPKTRPPSPQSNQDERYGPLSKVSASPPPKA